MSNCNIAEHLQKKKKSLLDTMVEKTAITYDVMVERSTFLTKVTGEYDEFLSKNAKEIVALQNNFNKFVGLKKVENKIGEVNYVTKKLFNAIDAERANSASVVIDKYFKDDTVLYKGKPLTLDRNDKQTLKSLIEETLKIYGSTGWNAKTLAAEVSNIPSIGSKNPIDFLTSDSTGKTLTVPIINIVSEEFGRGVIKTKENLKRMIGDYLIKDLDGIASETAIKNFTRDMLGEGLTAPGSIFGKLMTEARTWTSWLKFTAFPGSNVLYGGGAALMSSLEFAAKGKGRRVIMDNPLIDVLLTDEKFLLKESKAGDTYGVIAQELTDDDIVKMSLWAKGKSPQSILQTFIDQGVEKTARMIGLSDNSVNAFTKIGLKSKNIKAFALGGLQAIVDVALESRVKRLSISKALSSIGVNEFNIDQFLKNGKLTGLDKDTLTILRSRANTAYNRFYTAGHWIHSARDRFSRWLPFGFLQHYVTARTGEMLDGFRKLHIDRKSGVYNNLNFADYLNTHNNELRDFISSVGTSFMYGYYMGELLGTTDDIDDKNRWLKYGWVLNDRFSSMEAQFLARTIWSMMAGTADYNEFKNQTGDPATVGELSEAALIQLGTSITTSLFREFKLGNAFLATTGSAIEGGFDRDMVFTVLNTEVGRAINGMGRFGTMPGFERYGMNKVDQQDDWFSYYAFGLEKTNDSLKQYYKLKTVEGIQQALDEGALLNAWNKLQYSVLGYGVQKLFTGNPSAEAKYNYYQKLINEDQVLKDLLNGKFNGTVLESNGQLDSDKVYSIYSDLTKFDYSRVSFFEGMDNTKDEIFVQQVLDKIGESNYLDILAKSGYTAKQKGLAKILTLAEAEVQGSSRVILSYIANKRYEELVDVVAAQNHGLTGYDAYAGNLTPEEQTYIKAAVIEEWIPHMHIADGESWFKLLETRMVDLNFGKDWIDKNKTDYFSTLAFVDYIAYTEGKKPNPDAKYIQNIFAPIGKFLKNPEARIAVANYTMESIDELDIPYDKALMMKVGVLAGNIEFVNQLMKDKDFADKNSEAIKKFLETVWGTDQILNDIGIDIVKDDYDKEFTPKKGYTNYNKPSYYPSQGEQDARKTLQQNVPSYSSVPKYYRSGTPNTRYLKSVRFPNIKPEIASLYWRVEQYLKQARTQGLVSGYVRKYPADFYEHLKWKDQQSVKIKKIKRVKNSLFN